MKRLIAAVVFAMLSVSAFASDEGSRTESVWANDYHFIAPPQ
jgi:hypothetical protein